MNRIATWTFLTAVAFCLTAGQLPSAGQENTAGAKLWNLEECINYAIDNNIDIKQSALTVEKKNVDLNTAKGRVLPDLSASASQNFSFGRGLTEYNIYENSNTTSTGFSLGSSVPLFQGLDIKNDVAMSKLDLAAATSDLEKARDDIRTAVAAAYAEILYDKELLGVAVNQTALDSILLDRIEGMSEVGKASLAEVAAQKSTLAQSRLAQTQAFNNLQLDLLELSQLLELETPEGFDIICPPTESLELKLLMRPEDIYLEAIEIKPQISAEKIRLEYAKTGIARAQGAYMPSLMLSGGIGSNYYTSSSRTSDSFADQMKNNFSQYIGLSLNVPIFSRFSTRNQVKTARLNYTMQELQLQDTKKALFKEIQQAYYNAVASGSKMESSREAATSASESHSLMTGKYENGKANVTEYNESKNRYLEAQSNFLKARYEYLYLSSLLEFYRGKELKF